MIEKLIINKFKQVLGSQYELCDNDFFDRNFTTIVPVNGQYTQLINYDAFEKYGDKIIGVVQVQSAQYSVTSFTALNSTYSLTLWVPVNYKLVNANGELLKPDKFNVDSDIKNLREVLNNKTIDFGDGYKGEMTFSEPAPAGGGVENAGSYKRKILIVTGKINFTTKGYYGRDYKIEIGVLTETGGINYITVKDITSLSFNPQPSTIENHEQGDIIPEETVEAVKQGCIFTVDDSSEDETLNDFKYIYDTLNIVYNQEKEANTRSYRTFVNNYSGVDQNQFKTFYPIFVREYAHLIILLNNDLHPETDICKESDICEEYISAAEKYKFEADSKVLSIINKK